MIYNNLHCFTGALKAYSELIYILWHLLLYECIIGSQSSKEIICHNFWWGKILMILMNHTGITKIFLTTTYTVAPIKNYLQVAFIINSNGEDGVV